MKVVVHFGRDSARKQLPETWQISEMARETPARWYLTDSHKSSEIGYRSYLPKDEALGAFDSRAEAEAYIEAAKVELSGVMAAYRQALKAAQAAERARGAAQRNLYEAVDAFLKANPV